jgi:hypothetical protein
VRPDHSGLLNEQRDLEEVPDRLVHLVLAVFAPLQLRDPPRTPGSLIVNDDIHTATPELGPVRHRNHPGADLSCTSSEAGLLDSDCKVALTDVDERSILSQQLRGDLL